MFSLKGSFRKILFSYLIGGHKEDRSILFPEVHTGQAVDTSGLKFLHQKL